MKDEGIPLALTASLEDYLEAILVVSEGRGEVRPKDIVERMNVRGASVTGALRGLADRGLVRHTPYHRVTLTEEGARVARDVYRRHRTLRDFLVRILGVPTESAEGAACRLEHDVSPEILGRLRELADFISGCPRAQAANPARLLAEGAPASECATCGRPFPEGLKPALPGDGSRQA